ncbi:MAG: bifunctional glutamate N-acetyltransferase/amino-acid acetyltransferase ArgJ [Phycisphaerae bacterium]
MSKSKPNQDRHITLPDGFEAAGVRCGIKQAEVEDLAIIASRRDASAAMVLTTNQIVGAPILWNRSVFPRGYGKARAIVINAGCSNVCTGQRGLKDARTMASLTGRGIGAKTEQVLVASTGIIGQPLPMGKIRAGIAQAADQLGGEDDAAVARAILTTDTRPKSAMAKVDIEGKQVTVAGICKGSGMIAPSMATMIAVLTTDAAVSPSALHRALTRVTEHSFNAVTIDSDTSTSDTVAAFASGAAGNKSLTTRSAGFEPFVRALGDVCSSLAWQLAADGEGANRVIEVRVRGARNPKEAKLAAKAVADSPLVKTAVHGQDPNWGRIAMALGKSAAKVDAERLKIRIAGSTVFTRGTGRKFDAEKLSKRMGADVVTIEADLGLGDGQYTALTCDLSREYITINADYHT